MPFMRFFLSSTQILPGNSNAAGAAEGTATGGAMEMGFLGGLFEGNPMMLILIYFVAFVLIMYFLSIRPNQKKEKQMSEMREAIKVGDSVVTNGGMFGRVVDVTYGCFIIEFGLNKGVRVPVIKSEIYAKSEPNLSNEAPPPVEAAPKKKGLFGRG